MHTVVSGMIFVVKYENILLDDRLFRLFINLLFLAKNRRSSAQEHKHLNMYNTYIYKSRHMVVGGQKAGMPHYEYIYRKKENTIFIHTYIFDTNLKFHQHASEVAMKVNRVLACMNINLNEFVLSRLYKSMVRPILEYGNVIWGPHYVLDQRVCNGVLQN